MAMYPFYERGREGSVVEGRRPGCGLAEMATVNYLWVKFGKNETRTFGLDSGLSHRCKNIPNSHPSGAKLRLGSGLSRGCKNGSNSHLSGAKHTGEK
jgi:hypothetical protein